MKLRYLIPSFVAALTMFASCSDDNDPTYLDEVQVSSSYVAIPQDGGKTTITVTAKGDWAFESQQWVAGKDTTVAAGPQWLTISSVSGGAGQTEITFSAESTLDGRSCELLLTSAGKTQRINVIQGLSTISPATCAEVIAGPDSKSYRVTGTCVRIANTNYGNWYLEDETGQIYIYGTVDATGKYNWASFGIEVGDVVTVEGPKTTYNGTVELVDVTVVSVQKSLVKIEEGESASFDAAGGDFLVRLTVADGADGPYVKIDDAAQEWVGISSIEKTDSTVNVKFHVAANNGEQARTGNIEFTSSKGSTTSIVSASVSQMGLSGTLTNPFSVEDAIAYCQTLSGNSANDFYVKGKVSKIVYDYSANYGTGTFWISEDGEFNDDATKDFEIYSAYWLGNKSWAEGNAQVAVGDEVIICGKLTLYKGTAETSSKNAYVYSINSVTTDANGLGSLAYPFNVAGAEQFIDNGGSNDVFVEGKVSKIVYTFSASYGTGTFWISDDGTFNDDASLDFEAYSVYWLGNKAWTDSDDQIVEGDKVILHGQLTKYKTTYETSSKKAYVYSVNGKTE